MTGPEVPPIVVDHDDKWIEIDLAGDVGRWARGTAREIAGRVRAASRFSHRDERRLTAMLEGAAALARNAGDAAMALLLFPTLGDGMVALVRFCLIDLAGQEGQQAEDDLVKWLIPDGEASTADVTELSSAAGPCRRIRVLTRRVDQRPDDEHLAYVWAFPQYGMGVVASTSFTDPAAASRWLPALDALARGVGLRAAAS